MWCARAGLPFLKLKPERAGLLVRSPVCSFDSPSEADGARLDGLGAEAKADWEVVAVVVPAGVYSGVGVVQQLW